MLYPYHMTWRSLALALVLVPTSLSAQWYEWRDDRGVVHVTNEIAKTPRPEVAARTAPRPDGAPAADPAPTDPAAEELTRHRARLADREAYLRLLRADGVESAARRELENLVADEARQEAAAIDVLRAAPGPDGRVRRDEEN